VHVCVCVCVCTVTQLVWGQGRSVGVGKVWGGVPGWQHAGSMVRLCNYGSEFTHLRMVQGMYSMCLTYLLGNVIHYIKYHLEGRIPVVYCIWTQLFSSCF